MPDLDLSAITAARAAVGAQQDELRLTRLSLAEAKGRRDAAVARGEADRAAAAAAELADLDQRRVNLLGGIRGAAEAVRDRSEELASLFGHEPAVATLSAAHPILLLPVRIETRFFDQGQTLKVRLFPDQAHVTAHDPALTQDETDGLSWYWTTRWPDTDAAGDTGRALAEKAWQGLTARFRPGRAAFLVRTYPPANLGSGDPEPVWGNLPRRAGAWSAAARAGLLPDRWCVLGFRDDGEGRMTEIFRKWGRAVPDALSVGPSPEPGKPDRPGGMPDDPDLRWLHDAGEAERLGMLITVGPADLVPGIDLAAGVERLIAIGVDWTLDPAAAAAAVETHLGAIADEGKLSFIPQGVPSNSTTGTRSAYSTDIRLAEKVLAPHAAPVTTPDSAAPLTAGALGIPGLTVAGAPGADLREQTWQRALLDATWSALGGYYITTMLDPIGSRDPDIEVSMRRHVVDYLRASGPLPTLRIGAQPYGILPVTPRGRFQPDVRRRAQGDVKRLVGALRPLVQPLIRSVPRLAKVTRREDVDDMLLALLQRTPVAWSFTFRTLMGPIQRKYAGVYWDRIAQWQRSVTANVMMALDADETIQLTELTHDDRDHPLNVPLVLKPDPDDPKIKNTAYLEDIRAHLTAPGGDAILRVRKNSIALLEAFIACAAVMEFDRANPKVAAGSATVQLNPDFASYVKQPAVQVPYSLRIESEVAAAPIGAVVGAQTRPPATPLEFSSFVVPDLTGEKTISEFVSAQFREKIVLPGLLDVPEDPLHLLKRLHDALATLAAAPPDQLEWAFRGVLDLYSTRLDAWITSLATARLAEHREQAPTGLHIGGWGVVEGLRPDNPAVAASESLGFVHAPSLGQAASMAVMRSARLTHRDAEGRMFDLDLTSRRVRQAIRILEGISAGQRLAALLGYRIERGLQERDLLLAQWILPLRQQCPLRSERPNDPEVAEPVDVVAARDVVDGLALLQRWAAEGNGLLTAAKIDPGAFAAVGAVLDDVARLSDAVSDVLVSESVHQATSGNLERSGAALAAHDRQSPPPDPEFVRTPRAGAILTHRVGVWLPRDSVAPADGWPADLRSSAEPRLDRWLGQILGDPAHWTVQARLVRPALDADGNPVEEAAPTVVELAPIGVDSLGLSAMSLVLAARRPGSGTPSELESRLAAHYSQSAEVGALRPTADDRLDLVSDGLAALLDLAAWATDVLSAAPLSADHLASAVDVTTKAASATTDVAEAVGRAEVVLAQVQTLLTAARTATADHTQDPADPARETALLDALLALVEVEGPDALPSAGVVLAEHAESVLTHVQARIDAAMAMPVPTPAPVDPGDEPAPGVVEDGALVRARGMVRILLGNGQPFLPVLQPTDPALIAASLGDRAELIGDDPTVVVSWLHQSALVRPQLDPLSALLVHAEAAGADVGAQLAVVQTPRTPHQRWVALPFGPDGPPPAGSVGLVLHATAGLDPATGGAGVIVDSWTDAVPESSETTAVTFHFDAPGSRAPQSMLLAVHPDQNPDRWDFDTLVGCVHEAMDLAQLRTIGSKELAPFGTFLPAIFLPDSYTRDVAGVNYNDLVAAAVMNGVGGLVTDHILGKSVK